MYEIKSILTGCRNIIFMNDVTEHPDIQYVQNRHILMGNFSECNNGADVVDFNCS